MTWSRLLLFCNALITPNIAKLLLSVAPEVNINSEEFTPNKFEIEIRASLINLLNL